LGSILFKLRRQGSALAWDPLTAYDFAFEEVTAASSRLAHALLARTLKNDDVAWIERECSSARSVYQRLIDRHPRMRLDATQRASLLRELGLLRSRLEECLADEWTHRDWLLKELEHSPG
jgi:hypothetical protein